MLTKQPTELHLYLQARTVKTREVSPVVVHFYDLSNLKAEAGLLKVQGQFDLENNKTGTRVEESGYGGVCLQLEAGESGIQGPPLLCNPLG